MAKQSRRAQVSHSKNHQDHIVEEVFDDNLLPDASEIKKLSELDPNIVQWLKERAEKEQDFRHKTYTSRIKLFSKKERRLR